MSLATPRCSMPRSRQSVTTEVGGFLEKTAADEEGRASHTASGSAWQSCWSPEGSGKMLWIPGRAGWEKSRSGGREENKRNGKIETGTSESGCHNCDGVGRGAAPGRSRRPDRGGLFIVWVLAPQKAPINSTVRRTQGSERQTAANGSPKDRELPLEQV